MASMVRLLAEKLANIVSIDGNSARVVERVGIFSGLARGLVGEFSCQISFADFSSSLKFKNLVNFTSCFTFIVLVVGFKTLIPLLSLS